MNGMSWALPVAAYLVGSFPTGVVLSRRRYGIDVRDMGSGNIGATNITRNFGWKAGVATFLVDFMKGFLVVSLAVNGAEEHPWVVTASGIAVVLGHCFSVFLCGRGGKGVATTLGALFAALPLAGALMAIVYVLGLALTRISAIGSLVGIALVTLYAIAALPWGPQSVLVYGMAFIVLLRHQSNLRRLIDTLP